MIIAADHFPEDLPFIVDQYDRKQQTTKHRADRCARIFHAHDLPRFIFRSRVEHGLLQPRIPNQTHRSGHRRLRSRRGSRRFGAVGPVQPQVQRGPVLTGSQPLPDPAGQRQPSVSDRRQHGQERGAYPGDKRQHLQGRFSLLRPLIKFLHLLSPPQRLQKCRGRRCRAR